MRRGSLRTQLILWNVLILALLLGGLALVVRYTVTASLHRTVATVLERQVGHTMPPPGGGPEGPTEPPRRPGGSLPVSLEPRHFGLDGNPLGARKRLDQASIDAVLVTGERDTRRVRIDDEPMQILSVPMRQRGTLIGVEQVGYRLTELEEAERGLDRALLMLLPIGLLCAAAGGYLLTRRVLRRISATTDAARAMIGERQEAEPKQLPVSGNDEFSELAQVLNDLLLQQQRALEQQRRFTADASHELKSPLTVIKGTVGMALSGEPPFTPQQLRNSLQEIGHATDAMVGLVQDLLLLARSDSYQLGQNRIEVLLSEVLERAAKLTPAHDAPPVSLSLTDPALTVYGNEGELIRLFTNLFDNACRHTPQTGRITVTVTPESELLAIAVADTGVGIAPEHLPHLGERFYRVDDARTRSGRGGSGLGLSICQAIVAAHGGSVEITSRIGEGTTVTLRLPTPSAR
jgi:signal transduction histidine kinase